jgi:hypothetical protein
VLAMDNFWAGFWLLIIWIPIIMLDIFTLKDLFQRATSGWKVALWLAAIVFLPILGVILYWVFTPTKLARDVDEALKRAPHYEKTGAPAELSSKQGRD